MKKETIIFVILFFLLIMGTSLRFYNLARIARQSPDEQVYTYQAVSIAHHGLEAIKLLVGDYNVNKEQWIYPPPTRVGYLIPLAAVMKMANRADVNVGRYVSLVFNILAMGILVALALRFFNPWISLYAALFISISPMDLVISGRTWQDAVVGCMGAFLVYCCCEMTRNVNKILWYVLFIAAGSYFLLIKESGLIIYGLCLLWLFWLLTVRNKLFFRGILLLTFSLLGLGISAFLLARFIGGFSIIFEVLRHIKEAVPTNTYAVQYQSGPWYSFFEGFWILSPTNTILCLIGIFSALIFNKLPLKFGILSDGRSRTMILGIIFFMIGLTLITALIPHLKNLRYVSAVFVPFYLIGGLGLWYIICWARNYLGNFSFAVIVACIITVVSIGALCDYQQYVKIFIKKGAIDLSIRLLKQCS